VLESESKQAMDRLQIVSENLSNQCDEAIKEIRSLRKKLELIEILFGDNMETEIAELDNEMTELHSVKGSLGK